jgi:pimeloyl-ACP methyl ester carboxylesterase
MYLGTRSDYRGFDRYDHEVDGCATIVVAPHKIAPERPWIWRAEFFDHEPQADLALLDHGFHLTFIEVHNTFGCPWAMDRWDSFYAFLTGEYGLHDKAALEGLSRGGLYCYNWAARHPDRVACLYADAGVMDFKSWPAGRGGGDGNPAEWEKLLNDYGFASEEEALAYGGNPVDNLAPLAQAGIPLLHVYGDADAAVPPGENVLVVNERYEQLGGYIALICKHGVGHHPHALANPAPIVDFILRAYGLHQAAAL